MDENKDVLETSEVAEAAESAEKIEAAESVEAGEVIEPVEIIEPIEVVEAPRQRTRIFELPEKLDKTSDHPLGALQSVVRGRIRFVPYGLVVMAIALGALYILIFTDMNVEIARTPINIAIGVVLFAAVFAYGLRLVFIATRRIKLRRTGLELRSILGKRAYEYKDLKIAMNETLERSRKVRSNGTVSDRGYRSAWTCSIFIPGHKRPILVKSSQYAQVKYKMGQLVNSLTDVWAAA